MNENTKKEEENNDPGMEGVLDDEFYLAAAHEIERLVAAWGTPIEAKGGL